MYVYLVHFSVFLVKKELYNPTAKRVMKIFKRSVFMEMIIYLLIGNIGYYSMGEDTPKVIILRPALPNYKKDLPMLIARIAFTINL